MRKAPWIAVFTLGGLSGEAAVQIVNMWFSLTKAKATVEYMVFCLTLMVGCALMAIAVVKLSGRDL